MLITPVTQLLSLIPIVHIENQGLKLWDRCYTIRAAHCRAKKRLKLQLVVVVVVVVVRENQCKCARFDR